jgi:hypothetical protein
MSNGVTLDDLLEIRAFLEIPATRAGGPAALSPDHLVELELAIPGGRLELSLPARSSSTTRLPQDAAEGVRATRCCRSPADPIFTVSQTRLSRSGVGRDFHTASTRTTAGSTRQVAAVTPTCERLMREHLEWLRPEVRANLARATSSRVLTAP